MMGIKVVCCTQCFEVLSNDNPAIALAWVDICAEYVIQKLKVVEWGYEGPGIKILEKNGYITTQDPINSKSRLKVKPHGYKRLNDQHFFCVNEKEHMEIVS